MTKRPKPTVHGRDHEHGGADVTLIHWEDVGGEGGGASAPQARYDLTHAAVPAGALRYFEWAYIDGDGPLLDLTDPLVPTVIDAGVYAYSFAGYLPSLTSTDYFISSFVAMTPDGTQIGFNANMLQGSVGGYPLTVVGSFTVRQDAGGGAFVYFTNGSASAHDYEIGCFLVKVS
jgi:hypothetical protein